MPDDPSLSSPLEAYLGALRNYVAFAKEAWEARGGLSPRENRPVPDFDERRGRLLKALSDRRDAALLAGVRTGQIEFPEMRSLLNSCRNACIDHKQDYQERPFIALVQLVCKLLPPVGVLSDLITFAASPNGAALLDRVLAALSPNQSRIMEYLWGKKTASYATLRTIPGAWRGSPTDEAITAALKRMSTTLNKTNLPVTLTISVAKKRVTLDRPAG
jgi:hypothetical protein